METYRLYCLNYSPWVVHIYGGPRCVIPTWLLSYMHQGRQMTISSAKTRGVCTTLGTHKMIDLL